MSSYGFRAVSDSGALQLEDAGDFFRFHEHGFSGDVFFADDHLQFTINFSTPIPKGEPLILAMRCDVVPIGIGWYTTNANGDIDGYHCVCGGSQGDKVEYKVFARYGWNTPIVDEDYGLVLYDANGQMVYDSRVVEAHTLDILSISWSDGDSASHVSRPGAFYALPGLDYYFETLGTPLPGDPGNVDLYYNVYEQTGDSTLECWRVRQGTSVTTEQRFEQTGDGKTIIVDDDP